MRFRHEVKFLADIAMVDEFFKELEPFCDFDKHSGATNSYEIASVYYDTADLRFYLDREESVGYRRKIRLRTYNVEEQAQALFIEIKEKHKRLVAKKRINMKSMDILNMGIPHDELPLDMVISELEDSAEAREMAYLHDRLNLYPVALIRYIRKALIPKTEFDMRITFDTKITSGGNFLNKFDPDLEKYLCQPGQGVLEVKTNKNIPIWMQSILRKYPFKHTQFSKYCLGVDAIYGTDRPWMAFAENKLSSHVA